MISSYHLVCDLDTGPCSAICIEVAWTGFKCLVLRFRVFASSVKSRALASCHVSWAELGGACYHDYTASCTWLSLRVALMLAQNPWMVGG